jgi:hypothetical protein
MSLALSMCHPGSSRLGVHLLTVKLSVDFRVRDPGRKKVTQNTTNELCTITTGNRVDNGAVLGRNPRKQLRIAVG